MNELTGVIESITTEEHISLVVVKAAGTEWYTLVIDTPETTDYLQQGKSVALVFKESAVSIGKKITGLFSIRNRIPCLVSGIQSGSVLSTVSLRHNEQTLVSVITTNAVKDLALQTGDEVEALIKTTDIALMQADA